MKNKSLMLVLAVMLLVTLSCSLFDMADDLATEEQPAVVEAQPAQDTVAEELQDAGEASISQDGVTLYYDPDLILEVEASSVEASSGDEPYSTAHPAFPQFNLVLDSGTVSVVPAAAFREASADNASVLNELQGMIASQFLPDAGECVPDVPLVAFFHECGHQEIASGKKFISFQNGSGVRFVTVYGIQAIQPIDNEHLTYVFQGFTDDGKYYVSARFHITHAQMEDMLPDLPDEYYTDETGALVQDYFLHEEMFLDQNPDDFQPLLSHMDEIIGCLRIK